MFSIKQQHYNGRQFTVSYMATKTVMNAFEAEVPKRGGRRQCTCKWLQCSIWFMVTQKTLQSLCQLENEYEWSFSIFIYLIDFAVTSGLISLCFVSLIAGVAVKSHFTHTHTHTDCDCSSDCTAGVKHQWMSFLAPLNSKQLAKHLALHSGNCWQSLVTMETTSALLDMKLISETAHVANTRNSDHYILRN